MEVQSAFEGRSISYSLLQNHPCNTTFTRTTGTQAVYSNLNALAPVFQPEVKNSRPGSTPPITLPPNATNPTYTCNYYQHQPQQQYAAFNQPYYYAAGNNGHFVEPINYNAVAAYIPRPYNPPTPQPDAFHTPSPLQTAVYAANQPRGYNVGTPVPQFVYSAPPAAVVTTPPPVAAAVLGRGRAPSPMPDFSIEKLETMDSKTRYDDVGYYLYLKISGFLKTSDRVGKITGMFLEMSNETIEKLFQNKPFFESKINEAQEVLEAYEIVNKAATNSENQNENLPGDDSGLGNVLRFERSPLY